MTLVEDGTETDKTITLDGTKDDNGETADWTASWKNLPKYKADGKTEIKYSVKETDGWPGYTASSKDAVASGRTAGLATRLLQRTPSHPAARSQTRRIR